MQDTVDFPILQGLAPMSKLMKFSKNLEKLNKKFISNISFTKNDYQVI